MINYILKAGIGSMIVAVVGCGIWLLFGNIFTAGAYSMNYWQAVRTWFWILFIIDLLTGLFRYGIKDFDL